MIKWHCQKCGKELVAADHMRGRIMRCPACPEVFTVPDSAEHVPDQPAAPIATQFTQSDLDLLRVTIRDGVVSGMWKWWWQWFIIGVGLFFAGIVCMNFPNGR